MVVVVVVVVVALVVVALVVVVAVPWCSGARSHNLNYVLSDPPNDRTADRLPAWGPNAWLLSLMFVRGVLDLSLLERNLSYGHDTTHTRTHTHTHTHARAHTHTHTKRLARATGRRVLRTHVVAMWCHRVIS